MVADPRSKVLPKIAYLTSSQVSASHIYMRPRLHGRTGSTAPIQPPFSVATNVATPMERTLLNGSLVNTWKAKIAG